MAFQEGESSGSKSTASDSPNTPLPYNHPNTHSPAPQDPMNDLEHAYAALEIDDEVPDGLELEQSIDLSLTLVGRVIIDKTVKFVFMRDTLAVVWRPGRGMDVKEVGHNTFIFQFFHEIDLKRILDDGPWAFEQSLLVLARIQPHILPLAMNLDCADFWIQVHDLPPGFFSAKTTEAIGNFIGTFVSIDESNFDGWWKMFLRIRVRIDITKPLTSKMRIKRNGGDWLWISFRYERLPNFCFICGLLGHTEKFCQKLFEGFDISSEKPYGSWLRAANRRAPPTVGRRWLVLEQGIHPETNLPVGVHAMGGGTVPSTTYTQTDIHGTGATTNEHVSSVCTALPTESGSGTDIILGGAQAFLYQWLEVNCSANIPILATDQFIKWEKPPDGLLKINVDAALDIPSRKAGIGLVIRNSIEMTCAYVALHRGNLFPDSRNISNARKAARVPASPSPSTIPYCV
nr:uncharacterized protein LOC109173053 [Ipomoea batatas]